ncbi:MAG: sugar transferase [Gemmatimonadetes bacterium]|nr:sugar transferase [Gemmatimonadota bacterium]
MNALARQRANDLSDRHAPGLLTSTAAVTADRLRLKRLLDVVLAVGLVVLTLPVLLFSVLAIRLTSRGAVVFRQRRIGHHGREFMMLKLRTMHAEAPELEAALADDHDGIFLKVKGDARVTRVGRVLRTFSIDELPQLFNVLKGDMALVGPRPLLPTDMRRFPRGDVARRFEMKPGLTGLWQVSGRSLCSDSQRLQLDLEYVDRWSLWLDLSILARTPAAVLLARGAF